jgi:O-antigen/teichoic acid export membrane protein
LSILASRRIARNTIYLTGALVFQKIISFVYFSLIARLIGPEDIGQYVFALSFVTLFAVLVDIGLSPVLTREIAKFKEKSSSYLATILSVKIITALFTWFIIFLVINLLHKASLTRQLVMIAGLIMILDSFSTTIFAVFRGYQILKYEALATVLTKILVTFLGLGAIFLGFGLRALLGAILIGSLFYFSYSVIFLIKRIKIKPYLKFNPKIFKLLFKIALPFALAAFFTGLYGYIDSVLLSVLTQGNGNDLFLLAQSNRYVGWYSIAYKLTFALQFIPLALAAAIFPAFAHYFVISYQNLKYTFEKSMAYLIILSLPISGAMIFLGDKLILTIYGQAFEASIIPFQILISALLFVFLHYPLSSLLNACNKQTINTINVALALILNIIINIILIPHLTFKAPAIAAWFSYLLLFILGLVWSHTIVKYNKMFLLKVFFKTLLAVAFMDLFIIQFKESLSLLLIIPLATIIYLFFSLLLKNITVTDLKELYRTVIKKEV